MLTLFTLGLEGAASGDEYGAALLGSHDLVGDGAADLVVGAPGANEVHVFEVSADGELDEAGVIALSATAGASDFGRTLTSLVDGAWGAALVIGAPASSSVHLRIAGDNFSADVVVLSGTAGDEFGAAFAVGDFNGDGYDDLAVGASASASSGVAGGSVFVFDGSAAGLATTATVALSGASSGDGFGTALAAGDFNGDGYADLAVGAPGEGGDEGAVHVHSGSPVGLESTPGWSATGSASDAVGTGLSAGDVSGDGYDDLVVAAESYIRPATASGSAAGLTGLVGGAGWYWASPILGPPADADGDGIDDVPWFYFYEDVYTDPYCADWRGVGAAWAGEFASPELVALAPGGDHAAGVGAWLWAGEASDTGRVWRVYRDTDADDDGFGANLVGDQADCDDTDAGVHPLAVDVPGDGTDQDCTGEDASWTADTRTCLTLSTFAEARVWSTGPLASLSEVDTLLNAARAEVEAAGTALTVERMHGGVEDTTKTWALEGALAGTFVENETVTEHHDWDFADCWDWDEERLDEQFRLTWDSPTALGITALTGRRADGWASSYGSSVYSGGSGEYASEGVAWSGPDSATAFSQEVSASSWYLDSFSAYEVGESHSLTETLGSCSTAYTYSALDEGHSLTDHDESWTFATAGGSLEVRSTFTENECDEPDYVLGRQDGGTWTLLHDDTWEPVAGTDADADGWPLEAGDCDDADPLVRPCTDPINNCADNDCDGAIDFFDADRDGVGDCDDCAPTDARYARIRKWYAPDADGDGYGVAEVATDCIAPAGAVDDDGDCDDGDASVSPAGKEECNGRDDDCDGDLDEYSAGTWYVDDDGDGWGTERGDDCEGTTVPGDCDDADAAVHPTAEDEPGDGVDADCDGVDPAPVEEEAPSDKPPRKEPKVSAGCTTAQGGAWAWLFVPLALVRRRRG